MKLIDILVLDLPKLGGWPDGVIKMSQDYDGEVWCWRGCGYGKANSFARISEIAENHRKQGKDENLDCFVTRDQYEAALAASKPDWDGEGVPPVGADVQCICKQFPSEGQEKLLGKILYSGEYTILHTYKTNEQHHVPVESVLMTKHWSITPIRSEADKKREIGVLSLARADPTVGRFEYGEKMSDGRLIGYAWYELYDKIAAGEVAGIRID
ncbi:hypothetical protein IM295_05045 [Enterobacter cloacae complex sp. P14RS]|uniref:hypothetical protein n=1 Tax=Enterobacter TaxID=547 RepID=UPI0018669572|nr:MULTISPECIES: hypothetical protein [Enterobacter]MBE3480678.1 hypothetical protein [Enterobacter cloacae complex sp. P14RS]